MTDETPAAVVAAPEAVRVVETASVETPATVESAADTVTAEPAPPAVEPAPTPEPPASVETPAAAAVGAYAPVGNILENTVHKMLGGVTTLLHKEVTALTLEERNIAVRIKNDLAEFHSWFAQKFEALGTEVRERL